MLLQGSMSWRETDYNGKTFIENAPFNGQLNGGLISGKTDKQAGAELGQAQLQLGLGFTLIKVCCIILMITNYHYISLSTISL